MICKVLSSNLMQQEVESNTSERGAEEVWYPEMGQEELRNIYMMQEAHYSISTHQMNPASIFITGVNVNEAAMKEQVTSYEDLMENRADKVDATIKPPPEVVCKKRKRTAKKKNKEEVECQRMVHIAVERNRRKQMNEHLDVLRSLMPASYIQRGDQASIVGGTIEFVKELELALHSLIARRKNLAFQYSPSRSYDSSSSSSDTSSSSLKNNSSNNPTDSFQDQWKWMQKGSSNKGKGEGTHGSSNTSPNVDVEKIGTNAFRVRVLLSLGVTGHGHGHLLRLISVLQHSLKLLIRHLYVTTMDHTVFYSFDVHKQGQICVGDGGRASVEELAFSIQQIL